MGMGRKKKTASGAGTEGNAEAWNAAAAASNGTGAGAQGKIPLDADEERIRVDLELATPLSPTGLLHAAQKMAAAQTTIERLDKELADLQAAQKDDRALAKKERTQYAKEVESGSSWAVVPCIEVHQFRTRKVLVYRALPEGGPGEFVRERPMTGAELEKATFDIRTEERIDLEPEGTPAPEPQGEA
jgi:hypothetical protein